MGVIAQAAGGYAQGGYFVVVDGIVGPWFIHPFRGLGLPLHYIVLRPALDGTRADERTRHSKSVLDAAVTARDAALTAFPEGVDAALVSARAALAASVAEKEEVAAEFAE